MLLVWKIWDPTSHLPPEIKTTKCNLRDPSVQRLWGQVALKCFAFRDSAKIWNCPAIALIPKNLREWIKRVADSRSALSASSCRDQES